MEEEKKSRFCKKSYGAKTYLIYEETAMEDLDEISRRMLRHNSIPGYLSLSEERGDGKIYLRYDITGRKSLKERMQQPFTKKECTRILRALLACFFRAEEMMLHPAQLLWDENLIYIDTVEESLQMICLPLKKVDKNMLVLAFLQYFITTATYDTTEDRSYVADLLGQLNHPDCSVGSFYQSLQEMDNEIRDGVSSMDKNQMSVQQPRIASACAMSEQCTTTLQEGIQTISAMQATNTQEMSPPENTGIRQRATTQAALQSSQAARKNGAKKVIRLSGLRSEKMRALLHLLTHFSRDNWVRYRSGEYAIKNAAAETVGEEGRQTQSERPFRAEHTFIPYVSAGTTLLQSPDTVQEHAYLIRKKTGEKIAIAQDLFRIGTQAAYADYVIQGNSAVSRNHATIQRNGALYFLTDNHATNHSYVDDVLLAPGEPTVLYHGATIRLADEVFLFCNEETED